MSIEENKAIVKRLWEEYFGKRNEAVLEEVIAPDYVIHAAWKGWLTSEINGPESLKWELRTVVEGVPDMWVTIEQMIAEGDKVVTVISSGGTHLGDLDFGPNGPIRATGKQVSLLFARIARISEGKIVEEWDIANFGSLWQQLGAIPSPDASNA